MSKILQVIRVDKDYDFDEKQETETKSITIDVTDMEEDKDKEPSDMLVHKSMMISDVIDRHPDVVPILIESGMHCIGCGASMFETLEEGFIGHGMDNDEIARIIQNLNDYIKETTKKE